jgi:hypothetical protein
LFIWSQQSLAAVPPVKRMKQRNVSSELSLDEDAAPTLNTFGCVDGGLP